MADTKIIIGGTDTIIVLPQSLQGEQGPPGADGADGAPGANGQDGQDGQDGATGQGVPAGGTANQVLAKVNSTDYNTQWIDPTGIAEPANQVLYGTGTGFDSEAAFYYNPSNDRLGVGVSAAPLGGIHVGNRNATNSTDPGVLVSRTIVAANAAHDFSSSSDNANSLSFAAFDAAPRLSTTIGGASPHYVSFQSVPTISSSVVIASYYGFYDRGQNSGTVTNYYGALLLVPATGVTNYIGFGLSGTSSPTSNNAFGFSIVNLEAVNAYGIGLSGINGSSISRGLSITGMSGSNQRPIYTEAGASGINEFRTTATGDTNLLMFARGSVNAGEDMGIIWEAGSGATKYYSGRFSSEYDGSLRGSFSFFTNPTGASGTGALVNSAQVTYDGVINTLLGFRIAGAAAVKKYLRGNGTNFVASDLLAGDIAQGTATTGQVIAWSGTAFAPETITLKATATLDFPSTTTNTSADLTVTVTGAAVGDTVTVAPALGSIVANSNYTAWVSATDTVTVRLNNYGASTIDPASGSFKVIVHKY